MRKTLTLLLLALPTLLFVSCNSRETEDNADQAFVEYRDFVMEAETVSTTDLTETELRAMRKAIEDTVIWETESEDLRQQYEAREKRVRDQFDTYDEARQAEIEDLDTRYASAMEKREQRYQDVSRRYRLREEMLGLPVSADDLSPITAAELPAVYNRFVEKLEALAVDLEANEWNMVEGWWVALNNRKDELASQLSAADKNRIRQASDKYLEIRKSFATPA
ncbi:MAG: hypothetical protein LPK03_10055 [Pontibacter sp.]|nr:hypothetical protein [Pontibacter sp.]